MKNQSVKEALKLLKSHGYRIRLKPGKFRLKRNDIKKFREWTQWAAKTHERFLVAVAGVDRNTLTFHSMSGYEGRKKHASVIHKNGS